MLPGVTFILRSPIRVEPGGIVMNDIIVQFARLWGQREAYQDTEEEVRAAEELKAYDSQECLALLTIWAKEYLDSDNTERDTCVFFNEKVDALVAASSAAG